MIREMEQSDLIHVLENLSEAHFHEIAPVSWAADGNVKNQVADIISEYYVGQSWACLNSDEVPCVIGGMEPMTPGVVNAWALGTDDAESVMIEYTRYCRDEISKAIESGIVSRVQYATPLYQKSAHRWLSLIGLTLEASMEKFGKDGETYYLYSRVKE